MTEYIGGGIEAFPHFCAGDIPTYFISRTEKEAEMAVLQTLAKSLTERTTCWALSDIVNRDKWHRTYGVINWLKDNEGKTLSVIPGHPDFAKGREPVEVTIAEVLVLKPWTNYNSDNRVVAALVRFAYDEDDLRESMGWDEDDECDDCYY